MSETYFWVAALLDQVLNLDLRPNFKIARVLRVRAQKSRPLVPPPGHSRVSGGLPLQARAFGSAFARPVLMQSAPLGVEDARRFALRFQCQSVRRTPAYSPKPSQIIVWVGFLRDN